MIHPQRCAFSLAILSLTLVPTVRADDLEDSLARQPLAHPRLFWTEANDAEVRERIAADPLRRSTADYIIATADKILGAPPVERNQIGKRLLGVSRTCLKRVLHLAFAYRITGDERYLRRAEQEMLAAAAFSDWNRSHFLDVAEMTAALAIGYDWLYDDLSNEARDTIREAIVEQGLQQSVPGSQWWMTTTNNWNQVCHGGMTLGALAVLEDEPELANQIIRRAVKNVTIAMDEYQPHGAYPEGPGYWKYGTTFNVVLISALESALGSDFGLSQSPGFLESSDYYQHAIGPIGEYYNYADCGRGVTAAPAVWWFAARRDRPSLLLGERPRLSKLVQRGAGSASDSRRLLPLLLVWAKDTGESSAPAELHFHGDGANPVAMQRSSWEADATYVGIKGGSASTNHAHMDAGSFIMAADGVRWAIDLGSQSYNSLESQGVNLWDRKQEGDRWTVFRLSTWSHNTLMVNGQQQRVKGFAPIVQSSPASPMPHTVVDLTDVYAGQLAAARRGVVLHEDGSVIVQDEVRSLDKPTSVRWGMVTRADATIYGNHAVLTQDGKRVTLRVLSPPGVELETYETETPPASHDAKNPGTQMVGFHTEVAPESDARLVVVLMPEGSEGETPKVRALEEW